MRVLVVAAGSRGDVAPYTGLAARLREAGHEVTISAHAPFRELVVSGGARFHELPGDLLSVISVPTRDKPPSPGFLNRRIPELSRYLREVGRGAVVAAADADLVMATGAAPFAYDVAEGLGLPSMGVYLQPFEPSREYPPVVLNSGRSLGRFGNRLVAEIMVSTVFPYTRAAAAVRAELGLPRQRAATTRRRQADTRWPIFHGFSPAVLPRPADWRPGLEASGYWWPAENANWNPPRALTDFLDAGEPPVVISFGSMAAGAGRWLSDAVVGAVRAAGVRAVVQAGWAQLSVDAGEAILPVGEVPHGWLFPRAAAVVHHGGAGTTGAVFRAGVPAVVTPIYADQPLWGARVDALGVGPAPIPFTRLTADRLAGALRAACGNRTYRANAQRLSRLIATETGTAPVVEAVNRLQAG